MFSRRPSSRRRGQVPDIRFSRVSVHPVLANQSKQSEQHLRCDRSHVQIYPDLGKLQAASVIRHTESGPRATNASSCLPSYSQMSSFAEYTMTFGAEA